MSGGRLLKIFILDGLFPRPNRQGVVKFSALQENAVMKLLMRIGRVCMTIIYSTGLYAGEPVKPRVSLIAYKISKSLGLCAQSTIYSDLHM